MKFRICDAVELGDEYLPVLLRELFPWQKMRGAPVPEYIYKLQWEPNWVIDLGTRTQLLLIDFYNKEVEDFIENVMKFNFFGVGNVEDSIDDDWQMFKRRSMLARIDNDE
jgi:hypothetical protein